MLLKSKFLHVFLICIFFLVLAKISLPIHDNYFIAGGDFYQLIDVQRNTQRYLYAWIQQHGQGAYNNMQVSSPYYYVLLLIANIFHWSFIPPWVMLGLFLIFAFLSAYCALPFFFQRLSYKEKLFGSFLYSLNTFIVGIFSYTWGYTHHFLIYLMIPLLVGSFYRFVLERFTLKSFCLYMITFLVALPVFSNLSFLAILLFFQGLITLGLLATRRVSINRELCLKVLLMIFAICISSFAFLYPFILSYSSTIGKNSTNHSMGGENYLVNWLTSTNSNFFNSFILSMGNYRYPFSGSPLLLFNFLQASLCTLLFLVALIESINSKTMYSRKGKEVAFFLFLFLFFVFLSTRLSSPFESVLKAFYTFPLFILFRSEDKVFVILPLLYCLVVVGTLHLLKNKKKIKTLILIIAILLLSAPFWSQSVYQTLLGDYNRFANKQVPEYTYIVTIPQEYRDIQNVINTDLSETAILSLPYAVQNSLNWSNYPKWHFVGHDVLHLLFTHRYISANTYDHPNLETKLSFKDMSTFTSTEEVLAQLQRFGTKYVLWHKDIEPYWTREAEPLHKVLETLTDQKHMKKIASSDFFELYQLSDAFVSPIISVNSPSTVTYTKVNPTYYELDVNLNDKTELNFLQAFDPQWQVFLKKRSSAIPCQEPSISYFNQVKQCSSHTSFFPSLLSEVLLSPSSFQSSHKMSGEFANAWTLDPHFIEQHFDTHFYQKNNDGSIKVTLVLYYKNQTFFYITIFTHITLIFLISLVLFICKRRTTL